MIGDTLELAVDNVDIEYSRFCDSIHHLMHKLNNVDDDELIENADIIIQTCEELIDEMSRGYVEKNLCEIIDFLKELKEERGYN